MGAWVRKTRSQLHERLEEIDAGVIHIAGSTGDENDKQRPRTGSNRLIFQRQPLPCCHAVENVELPSSA